MPEARAPETGVVLVPALVGAATGAGVAELRPETAKGLVEASWLGIGGGFTTTDEIRALVGVVPEREWRWCHVVVWWVATKRLAETETGSLLVLGRCG